MATEIPTNLTGLYQYIIATLGTVIVTLAGANGWQWREGNKVAKERLAEVAMLHKTLSDTNTALKELSDTAKRRNEVTEKLGELIGQVSIALKMLTERLDLQHEHTNKDLEKAVEAVEVLAISLRETSGIISQGFTEVKAELRVISQ